MNAKFVVRSVGVILLISAIASYVLASGSRGIAKAVLLGNYREFQRAGCVDELALAKFQNGKFAGSWFLFPEHLYGSYDCGRLIANVNSAISAFCALLLLVVPIDRAVARADRLDSVCM